MKSAKKRRLVKKRTVVCSVDKISEANPVLCVETEELGSGVLRGEDCSVDVEGSAGVELASALGVENWERGKPFHLVSGKENAVESCSGDRTEDQLSEKVALSRLLVGGTVDNGPELLVSTKLSVDAIEVGVTLSKLLLVANGVVLEDVEKSIKVEVSDTAVEL